MCSCPPASRPDTEESNHVFKVSLRHKELQCSRTLPRRLDLSARQPSPSQRKQPEAGESLCPGPSTSSVSEHRSFVPGVCGQCAFGFLLQSA